MLCREIRPLRNKLQNVPEKVNDESNQDWKLGARLKIPSGDPRDECDPGELPLNKDISLLFMNLESF